MRFIVLLLVGFATLISPVVQAAEVKNIYEAEVPVNSQDRKERHLAIRTGLVTVLIKATGNSEVALQPGVPELLSRGISLLQQYRYKTQQRPDLETGEVIEQQIIWLRFDASGIDRALRDIGLAVWPKTRPSTLVWLAIEENRARRLYSEQDMALRDIVNREASRRSIPVTLPLMDLEDRSRLDVADIWANFQDSIMNASNRYRPEGVLVGRLSAVAGQWQGRWSYYKEGRAWDWQLNGTMEEVLGAGIDGAADVLAINVINSKPSSEQGALRVLVKNINNIDDYARSDAYLRSLDTVLDVQASQVETDRVMFNLVLRGDGDALERAINLSDRRTLRAERQTLVVQPAQIPGQQPVSSRPDLVYSLLP